MKLSPPAIVRPDKYTEELEDLAARHGLPLLRLAEAVSKAAADLRREDDTLLNEGAFVWGLAEFWKACKPDAVAEGDRFNEAFYDFVVETIGVVTGNAITRIEDELMLFDWQDE
jgi:hypothetical protein